MAGLICKIQNRPRHSPFSVLRPPIAKGCGCGPSCPQVQPGRSRASPRERENDHFALHDERDPFSKHSPLVVLAFRRAWSRLRWPAFPLLTGRGIRRRMASPRATHTMAFFPSCASYFREPAVFSFPPARETPVPARPSPRRGHCKAQDPQRSPRAINVPRPFLVFFFAPRGSLLRGTRTATKAGPYAFSPASGMEQIAFSFLGLCLPTRMNLTRSFLFILRNTNIKLAPLLQTKRPGKDLNTALFSFL
jgi:hypothetical protein